MADLPDFDALWNYDQPTETEARLRALVPQARESDNVPYYAELLTQIARTEGLQRKFEEAQATLDVVQTLLANGLTQSRAYVRYLLERGRVLNSSKHPSQARSHFIEAWNLANLLNEDALAVDAAHMVAIVEPPEGQMEWNLKAMALAEKSADPRARKWLGSLYNNLGWTHHDAGRYAEALDLFEKGVQFRAELKQELELRIAKWCVARCLRSLGRVDEALARQQALLAESGSNNDGYVYEELGECLLASSRTDEARPYFGQAYALLSQDSWLVENEAGRLARLKELSQSEGSDG
jgi:tetratricopeptide (TPR) repeat protein